MSEQQTIDAVTKLAALQRDNGPDIDQLLAFAEEIDWVLIEKALPILTGDFSGTYKLIAKRNNHTRAHLYIEAAQSFKHKDGELEIDDVAAVSVSEEPDVHGAYVHAWVWVEDSDAGIERCSECGEILPEAGDGEDGLCATCADQKANETTNCKHCDLEVLQAKAINGEFCSPACADTHEKE